ncbi:MAG: trigger factor [Deltaproteobacteria bacterium]|nr:trigger factor [Deltaproteobacteria bacterium]
MSTIEEVSNTKRKINLEIPVEEVGPFFEEALERFGKNLKLKGFRPGKIPRNVMIKHCMPQIRKHLIDNLVSNKIYAGIHDHELEPISFPAIESLSIVEGEPIACVASFDLYPTFDLPDLSDISLFKRAVSVSDEEIENVLEDLRQRQATILTVEEDRPATNGDIVEIGFQIYHNDKPVQVKKDEKATFTFTLGEERKFYPEVVAAVAGMKKGEVKDVTVRMPPYSPMKNIAGKFVIFKITLNAVRVKELPALDDEFAKDTGFPDVVDLQSLKAFIVKEVTDNKEEDSLQELHVRLLGKIIERVDVEVPESLLLAEARASVENFKKNVSMRYGGAIDPNLFLTPQQFELLRKEAEISLKRSLIINKVRTEQEIVSSEKELDEALAELSYVTGQPIEVIKKFYDEGSDNLQSCKNKIENRKAFEFLRSQVKIAESSDPNDFLTPTSEALLAAATEDALKDADAEAASEGAGPEAAGS